MEHYGPKMKTLSDTKAGELIYLPDEQHGGWAIVSSPKTEDAQARLMVIAPSSDKGKAQCTSYASDEPCAAFGTDWCFEIVVDHRRETWPTKGEGQIGDWASANEDVGLILADKGAKPFSLSKLQQFSAQAISGRHWRVWASEADARNPNAVPLVTSPAAAESV